MSLSRDEFVSALREALGPIKSQVDKAAQQAAAAEENAAEARRMLGVLLGAPVPKGAAEHTLAETPIGIRPYRDQAEHVSDLNTVLGELLDLARHNRDQLDR